MSEVGFALPKELRWLWTQAQDEERATLMPMIALLIGKLGGVVTITPCELATGVAAGTRIEQSTDPATGAVTLRVVVREEVTPRGEAEARQEGRQEGAEEAGVV